MSSNIARGDISRAGIIFFIRPSTAGIIRVRVLFEGRSYMRKYGKLVWHPWQLKKIKILGSVLELPAK